jgi:hypothetical protein
MRRLDVVKTWLPLLEKRRHPLLLISRRKQSMKHPPLERKRTGQHTPAAIGKAKDNGGDPAPESSSKPA